MKWLEVLTMLAWITLLGILTTGAAHGAEIRPKNAPPESGIILGNCAPPKLVVPKDPVEGEEPFYVIECSSGAIILLPSKLVVPFLPEEEI